MSFNKIIIYGHLGRDPELRYTPQGTPACDFSVATTERRKEEEITTWFKVVTWGKMAETASQYLFKGGPVYVEGRVRLDTWTDRNGKDRTTLLVNATELKLMGGKQSESRPQETARAATAGADMADDDVPF